MDEEKIKQALTELPFEIVITLCAILIKEHEAYNWKNLIRDLRSLKDAK